ncbi:MAG: hypothetical protein HBSAPP03_00070 [Phycisphaerae bacterium]|nr:MAG: hypothetical protein HBSAPP03_00070 [Phycisphaerae bacterium]
MSMDRRGFLVSAAGAAAGLALLPETLPAAVRPSAGPVNLAIIGCGRQGRRLGIELIDKLGEGARVAAVCDLEERLARNLAGRARDAQVFTSYKELLDKAKDVQAVIVATPTHLHKAVALDSVAAGKHVYCEAPLAHTPEECAEIARAARGASTVFAVGCEGRSNPIYQLARTFYKTDAVRDSVSVYAQDHAKTTWGRPGDWWLDPATSIGLPGEKGVQQFDVAHWYRGSYPKEVEARGSIRLHQDGREVPDTVRATLRWADGVELHYDATIANSFGGRHETFFNTNAAIKLAWTHGWMFKEPDSPQLGFEVYANRQQFHNDEGITLIADATKLAAQGKLKEGVGLPNLSHYYALNDFLAAVSTGRAPACTASEGARATMVAIRVNEAVKKGGTLTFDQAALTGV